MKRVFIASLTLLVAACITLAVQTNSSTTAAAQGSAAAAKPAVKRGPVFRATREQVKQAQALLRTRGFYTGQESGKIDTDTRAALRKYQEAEGIKVTGTMNKATLERMNIALTEKQREWKPAP